MVDRSLTPNSDKPDVSPVGLDPVSQPGFDGLVASAEEEDRYYSERSSARQPAEWKQARFSPATWVMIVIAGVFLGIALAMMAAGG